MKGTANPVNGFGQSSNNGDNTNSRGWNNRPRQYNGKSSQGNSNSGAMKTLDFYLSGIRDAFQQLALGETGESSGPKPANDIFTHRNRRADEGLPPPNHRVANTAQESAATSSGSQESEAQDEVSYDTPPGPST